MFCKAYVLVTYLLKSKLANHALKIEYRKIFPTKNNRLHGE